MSKEDGGKFVYHKYISDFKPFCGIKLGGKHKVTKYWSVVTCKKCVSMLSASKDAR